MNPVSNDATAVEVVTVGEAMVMFASADLTPLDQATNLAVHVGGAESNVAIWLSGLGHTTRWISKLGDDPFGRLIEREIREAGVDVGAVEHVKGGRTGVYMKDSANGRTAVYYYRESSAACALGPDVLEDGLVRGARLVHVSGITAAISRSCRELVFALCRRRRGMGESLSFDVNFRPGLWDPAEAGPVLQAAADQSDLVFVGLDEASVLWGCRSPEDVRRRLAEPAVVVVKDGAIGAWDLPKTGPVTFAPSLKVEAREPVGAGDAFAAGYIAGLLEGRPPESRLRLGHMVAATVLRNPSDRGHLPSRIWLEAQLRLDQAGWMEVQLPDSAGKAEMSLLERRESL